MRFHRLRFTVRRLMVAVAIVGLFFGVAGWMERKRARFESLAFAYWEEGFGWANYGQGMPDANPRGAWNWAMFEKYERAARLPLLPLMPDPPEPK